MVIHFRHMKFGVLFCLVATLTLMSVVASAQNAPAAAKKEKKTSLSFEDEMVEGQNAKPELFYLFQKKNFNYKRLIRLRENFLPEMRKTSEDIQRSRGSN